MVSLGLQLCKNEDETRIKAFMASPYISISGKSCKILRVIQSYSNEIPLGTSPIPHPEVSDNRTAFGVTPCTLC